MKLLATPSPQRRSRGFSANFQAQLRIEELESRLVPYSVSGNSWPRPELITLSFMPDGTNLGGATSNLSRSFTSRFGTSARWQNEILRAAQSWAQQTNINFAVVPDSGAAAGSGNYLQGDPNFGDIRIGGFGFASNTLASAYMPPPVNNYSAAGDLNFNTSATFNVGSTYDLFTTAAHEIGHALGLTHSSLATAMMYPYYTGLKQALSSDDIKGIRMIYSQGTGRTADSLDIVASNGSFDTATNISGWIDSTTNEAVLKGLDITTTSDLDYYRVVAPYTTTGTFTFTVQSSGISLLAPQVRVFDEARRELAFQSKLGTQGATLTGTIAGIQPGQTFFVQVDGADNTAFGTGRYALLLSFGGAASVGDVTYDSTVALSAEVCGGGGIAIRPRSDKAATSRNITHPALESHAEAGEHDHAKQGHAYGPEVSDLASSWESSLAELSEMLATAATIPDGAGSTIHQNTQADVQFQIQPWWHVLNVSHVPQVQDRGFQCTALGRIDGFPEVLGTSPHHTPPRSSDHAATSLLNQVAVDQTMIEYLEGTGTDGNPAASVVPSSIHSEFETPQLMDETWAAVAGLVLALGSGAADSRKQRQHAVPR